MIIGCGCDITEIKRFLNKKEDFISKILTEEEKMEYKARKRKAEFLAGHFSVKESIIKAIYEYEQPNMLDLTIYYENNIPKCKYKNYNIFISISHEKKYAISYCVISK